ncbi:hypothetical protein GGR56DRAFT_650635 [Xylariaceae sp. FL0804]|nr:hypothetical protein GGR56DRAFT_650635 [Xylariaceae sp. FL0804]
MDTPGTCSHVILLLDIMFFLLRLALVPSAALRKRPMGSHTMHVYLTTSMVFDAPVPVLTEELVLPLPAQVGWLPEQTCVDLVRDGRRRDDPRWRQDDPR